VLKLVPCRKKDFNGTKIHLNQIIMRTLKHILLLIGIVIISNSMTSLKEATPPKETHSKSVLVIHGGAGTILRENMSNEKDKAYRDKLEQVLRSGMKALKSGKTSVETVEIVIQLMEDSPLFNAGKGAVFNHKGAQEMDASIMSGLDLNAGAVAGVQHIKNPITAARMVMEKSKHVMLSGEGAEHFAREQELELVDPKYFYNEDRYRQFKNAIRRAKEAEQGVKSTKPADKEDGRQGSIWSKESEKFGTVGAVALDYKGNLAAGTSTGGMTNKQYGRIGDSPIIGAGTYANNKTCAVSCTGHGEYFIRNVVAYDVAAIMDYQNKSVKEAAEYVVNTKLKEQSASGGLIALDAKGNVAMPFNTKGMYRGVIYEDGRVEIKIYADE
jgi:beta-aspartyl-peptidase (threonine type)